MVGGPAAERPAQLPDKGRRRRRDTYKKALPSLPPSLPSRDVTAFSLSLPSFLPPCSERGHFRLPSMNAALPPRPPARLLPLPLSLPHSFTRRRRIGGRSRCRCRRCRGPSASSRPFILSDGGPTWTSICYFRPSIRLYMLDESCARNNTSHILEDAEFIRCV